MAKRVSYAMLTTAYCSKMLYRMQNWNSKNACKKMMRSTVDRELLLDPHTKAFSLHILAECKLHILWRNAKPNLAAPVTTSRNCRATQHVLRAGTLFQSENARVHKLYGSEAESSYSGC